MKEKPHIMDRYTFGNSQAAQNLIGNILPKPEYMKYSKRVTRLLSKQISILKLVNCISNETTRKATLRMWHRHFVELCLDLPEAVRTHTLCVETGWYRQTLKGVDIQDKVDFGLSVHEAAWQQAKTEVAREIFEEIERNRFAEPQHIPEAGKGLVIICLTEDDLQSLKDRFLKEKK